jgi:transposase-like protein
MRRYQTPHALAPEAGAVITDTLEAVAREGARRMLEQALRAEVYEHLGRAHYERGPAHTGYRNGYARPREIGIGTWSVAVRAPRVSDIPPDAPPFESAILPRRRYLSASTQRLFARLYLEGLSSGDFEPAFRELLGERAPLSATTTIIGSRTPGRPTTSAGEPARSAAATRTSGRTGSISVPDSRRSIRVCS